jgi:hypothetical protein
MFEVLGLVDRLNVFSTTGWSVLGPSPNGLLSVISLVVAGCWKPPDRPTGTASTSSTGANAPGTERRRRCRRTSTTPTMQPPPGIGPMPNVPWPQHIASPRGRRPGRRRARPTPRRGPHRQWRLRGAQPLHPPRPRHGSSPQRRWPHDIHTSGRPPHRTARANFKPHLAHGAKLTYSLIQRDRRESVNCENSRGTSAGRDGGC